MNFFRSKIHGRGCRACLAVALIITGCRSPEPGSGGARLNAAERMMWSTYPVGTPKSSGTGIAILLPERGASGGKVTAVVTSAHVLEAKGNGPVFLAVRLPDSKGHMQSAIVKIYPQPGAEKYYVRHPHHDVAAFAFEVPPEAAGVIAMPSCLDSKNIGRAGAALHAGDEVFFAGYPEVMPYTDGFFPILRSGRVGSYPVATSQVNDMFCIDADAWPGDSGAPVFAVQTKGRPRLEGMIVRRAGDLKNNSHLAIAVHARAIRETVDLLAAREHRAVSGAGAIPGTAQLPPRAAARSASLQRQPVSEYA